jgi:hypothetical protein
MRLKDRRGWHELRAIGGYSLELKTYRFPMQSLQGRAVVV